MKTLNLFLTILFLFIFSHPVIGSDEILPQRGICSHRGENGVFPENTVIGFQEAVRLGTAQVEFDVRRTKDNQLIIMHDATVDRTTNGTGKTTDLTLEEIRTLDAGIKKGERFIGTRVPTFEEALNSLPQNIWINIHVYASNPIEIAAIIVEKKREHQAFLACKRKDALTVKEKYPQIKICNMERRDNISQYIRETIEWKCEFIQLMGKLGSPEEMKALKDAGVRINYTIAKNSQQFKELLEAGVDFPLADRTAHFVDIAKTLGVLMGDH
ncbi:MAG: glycerophosphodiester phosphodiesterase family protein [Planctomycetaceae bacterium]|jgi:glycerophosphoryl diester phosphodiesterase|nr:glycerophosphodiester phosphodiesterase family protein [Planctomycetaceae bacterium]